MIAPDATVTLDFALARLAGLIERLVVYPETMRANLERGGGLMHSQQVLLALTQKGLPREEAYRLVQRNAMRAFAGEGSFLDFLKQDQEVAAHLSPGELDALSDLSHHLKHVDEIFGRVFPVSSEDAA
jgi:adenylosuccinate lyase